METTLILLVVVPQILMLLARAYVVA